MSILATVRTLLATALLGASLFVNTQTLAQTPLKIVTSDQAGGGMWIR